MSTTAPLNGLIFDFDGTVADTLPVCIATFRGTIEKFTGRRMPEPEIVAMFGPSEEGMVRQMMPDRYDEAMQYYFSLYEEVHHICTEPYPGMADCVRLLRERNIGVGLVTGKSARAAEISLRRVGLAGCFDPIEAGSPDGNIKPKAIQKVLEYWGLRPEEVAYVGDHASDVDSAREAGVRALSAAWGNDWEIGPILERNPDAVFHSVADMMDWIERLRESFPDSIRPTA